MGIKENNKSEPELTHAYCMERAARTIQSLYTTNAMTSEHIANTLSVVDRWLAVAEEIRRGDELASYKFNALKEQLEKDAM